MVTMVGTPVRVVEFSSPQSNLGRDLVEGFARRPKELPSKYLYDARGTELFDAITELEEYYPTRKELEILERFSGDIAEATGAEEIVELGPGSSLKAEILLSGFTRRDGLQRYIPLDISPSAVRNAAVPIAESYSELDICGVIGNFHDDLHRIPRRGRRLIAFLGGTIGNFKDEEILSFLSGIRAVMRPEDALVVGMDLAPGHVKTEEDIRLAYNDPAGITAAFNKNVLAMLRRELGADLDPDDFEHQAPYVSRKKRIEMRLVSLVDQQICFERLEHRFGLKEGEFVRTEISRKWDRPGVEKILAASRLRLARWFSDGEAFFLLALCRPVLEEARS